jgi:GTP-binding protein EngB required for normal cell division
MNEQKVNSVDAEELSRIKECIVQGIESGIAKNNKRILAQNHIDEINQDLKETGKRIISSLCSTNVCLFGRYQSGKTVLLNELTGLKCEEGRGYKPCTTEIQFDRMLRNPGITIFDTPGSGDARFTKPGDKSAERYDVHISMIMNISMIDIAVLVVEARDVLDVDLFERNNVYLTRFASLYKIQHKAVLPLIVVITKVEDTNEEERNIMIEQFTNNFYEGLNGNIIFRTKGDPSDIEETICRLDRDHRISDTKHRSFKDLRLTTCRSFIWSSALKSFAYGLIPGLDLVFYVILTETIDIFLCAVYGRTLDYLTLGLGSVLKTFDVISRCAIIGTGFVAKALQATIVLFVVGSGAGGTLNFIGVLSSGYITWTRLSYDEI